MVRFASPRFLVPFALTVPAWASPSPAPARPAPFQETTPEEPAATEERAALPERGPVPTTGTLPIAWTEALDWRSIGPANMGGRITDIAVHPDDTSEVWLATATGGVVHTENGGITYEHQFQNQRVSSIGAIAVAPSDPDRVWVGTGEANPRNSSSWGDGVYTSADGGATWRWAGLGESFQVSTIVIHPEDADTVYVGALGRLWGPNDERGLYRTTDGGRTWERILFVDEDTGVVDVRMHPTDPKTLLVATYERRRDGFDTNDPAVKWGDGSALWRTTDGGDTFERLSEGLPTGKLGRIGISWSESTPGNVYAIVETDRITQEPENAAWFGIDFARRRFGEDVPARPEFGARVDEIEKDSPAAAAGLVAGDVILRIADTPVLDTNRWNRLLRDHVAGDSTTLEVLRDGEILELEITFDARPADEEERLDVHGRRRDGPFGIGLGGQRANAQDEQGPEGFEFGGIFRSTDSGSTWTRINSLDPRPMYYSEIRVDPSDENRIYVLGTRLHRSEDGGRTFTNDGHGNDVHVDHHALWIDPHDGRHIILGNDGGIYVTRDRMATWDHHNKLALGQFYNVSAGPRDVYTVYGGLQDNGTWGGPSRTADAGPTNADWFRVGGGDGFRAFADPEDPEVVYYESQNGGMGRRDFATGQGRSIRPRAERGSDMDLRFTWNTPYLLSHFNSRIVYSAGSHVFRSVERGENARAISPEITATDRGAAVALAESPRDQDLLWVGSDDGALWSTEDGGTTWTDLFALNGKPAFEKDSDESAPEPRASTVALPTQDGLAGTWTCRATGEGIETEDQGLFTLVFEVADSGRVTGTIDSDVGKGALSRVRYGEKEGTLRFRFVGDSLIMDFDARVDTENGSIEGTLTAAEGAFRFDWTGTRAAAESADTAEKSKDEEPKAPEPSEGDDAAPSDAKKKKKHKFIEGTIDQLVPGRRYISDIEPSHFDVRRVYLTLDGHRSDDTLPYVFVSEDKGRTWESIRSNLPDAAGSVRVIHEDRTNEDVLYLGTEHGLYASIDRGKSWTRINANLPTVPVHDLAQHLGTGELIVGTHGRSIWIGDVSALGQLTDEALEADATLLAPSAVRLFARAPERGRDGNHGFVGENPESGAVLTYLLTRRAREVALEVSDASGAVVATLEGATDKGLHRAPWNLRTEVEATRGRRRVRRARPGLYTVRLRVDGNTVGEARTLELMNDPSQPTTEWIHFEEEWEAFEAERGDEEEGGAVAPGDGEESEEGRE